MSIDFLIKHKYEEIDIDINRKNTCKRHASVVMNA